MTAEEPLIKEHKYGCSINVPICKTCNQRYNTYGPGIGQYKIPQVGGGFLFKKFFVYCTRCKGMLEASEKELEVLNRYSMDGQLFQTRVLFPPAKHGGPNYVSKIYTHDPHNGISR